MTIKKESIYLSLSFILTVFNGYLLQSVNKIEYELNIVLEFLLYLTTGMFGNLISVFCIILYEYLKDMDEEKELDINRTSVFIVSPIIVFFLLMFYGVLYF